MVSKTDLASIGRKDPHAQRSNFAEVALLSGALAVAVYLAFFDRNPLSTQVLLGPVWAVVWTVTLFVGSVVCLAGMFWRGRALTGLSLMQVGYTAFAPASLARAVALVDVGRIDESIIVFMLALAAVGRLAQIELYVSRHYSSGRHLFRRLR